MRMLQRSVGHSHSRDSAIDTDLQVRLKLTKSNSTLVLSPNYILRALHDLILHSAFPMSAIFVSYLNSNLLFADEVNLAWLESFDI